MCLIHNNIMELSNARVPTISTMLIYFNIHTYRANRGHDDIILYRYFRGINIGRYYTVNVSVSALLYSGPYRM